MGCLHGHRPITDAQLLALAIGPGGRLVTQELTAARQPPFVAVRPQWA